MIDVLDAIVATIGVVDDNIKGRTTIQKLVYFESVVGLVRVNYRPHYYGPYCGEVAGILQELTALDFVKEEVETRKSTGYLVSDGWKRYCYRLTSAGDDFFDAAKKEHPNEYEYIKNLVDVCKAKSALDPKILSWAAKVHYILSCENKSMKREGIVTAAETFTWELSKEQIDVAIELLEHLDLVKYDDHE